MGASFSSLGFGGSGAGPHVYFETAAAIVALLLLGKYFEARARGRSSHAIRALLELGAKTARLENGEEVPTASLARRRPLRRAPGREDRHRRHRRRRRVGARRVDAHRRAGAGRRRARRRGVRRHAEHVGTARGRGHPGRERHRAGADRPAGRGGPGREGPGAATGRPHLGGVRARGDGGRLRHARGVAVAGQPRRPGVHRRGRGADHRLPVRARARHAHGDHGRHRTRRAARHRDQGRRRARGDAHRSMPRCSTRPEPSPRGAWSWPTSSRFPVPTSPSSCDRAGSVEDASEHPIARAIAAGARARGAVLDAPAEFTNDPGQGVEATVDGVAIRVGRSEYVGDLGPRRCDALDGDARTVGLRGVGRRGAGRCSSLRTRSSRPRARRSPRCTSWASRP